MNKTIDIYSMRIYQMGTIILCDKKKIFRFICLSLANPQNLTQSGKVTPD